MIGISASERGVKNLGADWKNIVTDYGATPGGSGTSNGDYTAFKNFHDWAVEQSGWVGLVLPPSSGSGQYYGVNGSYATGANMPFFGIPKLIVMGYGASMNGLHGGALVNTAINNRAPVYSVNAGSTVLQLKNEDDAALFEVGKMILLAGLDLQGGWGYPPNNHYNEWHRIAAIDGDLITLERPIRYDYKDDWPRWFEGHEFELGGLGPATICRTIAGWDCDHRIYGLRSYKPGQQTYYFVRKAYLFDVKSADDGWIIGASEDHRIVNQQHTTSLHEVDKLTGNALVGEYGPSNRNLQIQSSSVDFMHVRGGTRPIVGTARNMLITGGNRTTITLGPSAYGVSEYIEIRDAVVTESISGAPGFGISLDENFTYEGDGVFRLAEPDTDASRSLIPGAVFIFGTASPFHMHHPFRVLGVRSENGEINGPVLVDTTLEGDELPALVDIANTGILRYAAHNLTVINCTGCPNAVELSMVPPNSPYGIFKRRTLDGLTANNAMGTLFGRLVHLKVNVTQAYTGVAGALNMTIGGQFGGWIVNADNTVTRTENPAIRINLKAAGERVITPSGVTGTQTGDTNLTLLTGGVWMPNNFGFSVYIGNGSSPVNISGEDPSVRPSVTVEILTDQEIPQ